MSNPIFDKFAPKFTLQDLKELEVIDQAFIFEHFTSLDAYRLGQIIIDLSLRYTDQISLTIIRESDELPIFQFVNDKKAMRNIDFAMKKRNTVLKTNHNSLWAMAKASQDPSFTLDESCLPVGGSFPVIVNGELVATVSVSGLHDGKDFDLLFNAFKIYFNCFDLNYHGFKI